MNESSWRDPWAWVTGLGYLVALVGLVYPLGSVLLASLSDGQGEFSLVNYAELGTEPGYRQALLNTLVVSLGGTALALVLGVSLAVLVRRARVPGVGWLKSLALLAVLSPPFIGAYAWIMALGQRGFLRLAWEQVGLGSLVELPVIYGPLGIVLVFGLQYYPFVFLLTEKGLGTIDPRLEEAAASQGAGPWSRLWRVTLPLVLPSISGGALVVFLLCLANFGTPMVLGRGYRVLSTLAYTLFTSEVSQNPGRAAAVCALMIGLASLVIALQRWLAGRVGRSGGGGAPSPAQPQAVRGRAGWLAGAGAWAIVLASLAPLAVVVATSFRRSSGRVFQPGLGLDSYRQVLDSVPRAIGNSLLFAFAATVVIAVAGTAFGFVVARRRTLAARLLDPLLMVPYVIPGIVLGLGLVTAFNRPPLVLTGTAFVLVLAFTVRRLPYAVRANASFLDQLDPAVEEAARNQGAGPGGTFLRVTLPLMRPGVAAGALLAWIMSLNELSASIVLFTGRTITMPVSIYQYVVDGSYGPASALATILLVATFGSLLVLQRLAGDEAGLV